MNLKQDIAATLQELHAHVTQKKDAAAAAAVADPHLIVPPHVSVSVLTEIASVIEKLIELFTGPPAPPVAPAS